jgi:hypothetical protein
VVSSIQLIANEHGSEKWDNFPAERARFLQLLRRTQARGVVVVSGDRHMAELSRLTPADGVPYPIYDLTTSGLNQPVPAKPKEGQAPPARKPQLNRYRLHERPYTDSNFGLMQVKWDNLQPSLCLEVPGAGGTSCDFPGHSLLRDPLIPADAALARPGQPHGAGAAETPRGCSATAGAPGAGARLTFLAGGT